MINEVVLEGIVVKTWKYADDLLFRLASYRDPDLPQKPFHPLNGDQRAGDVQDAADFVTVRVTRGSLGAPVAVEKGVQVRVHGFLQSRDYEETLADFLKDARGAALTLPENTDPAELRAPRGTTEVIARRIMNQRNGLRK